MDRATPSFASIHRLFLSIFALLGFGLVALTPVDGAAYSRSWHFMTTGNSHGFQVFDRDAKRIKTFLEHPYRFVAPGDDERKSGIGRRNLAHDIYFGVRAGGQTTWLHDQTSVEYEQQSNIIHASSSQSGVQTDTYYFGPYGLEANAMVMLIKATNTTGGSQEVSLYAKPNLKLGQGRIDPGEENESISAGSQDGVDYLVETGPGGGHAIYTAIGGYDKAICGTDAPVYDAVKTSGDPGSQQNCNGSGIVPVFQKTFSLAAGESATWGIAILFVNDNPVHARAQLFKDDRSVADVIGQWKAWLADRDGAQVHAGVLEEWEDWRTNPAPGLSDTEIKLWRQSEVVLRMGQVLEPLQANRRNHGMFLAALPVGEWHTGWLRDGIYAIVAMAKLGHVLEAQLGVEMALGADNSLFSTANFLKYPYRVSATRYYGNGMEEGDWNEDGPNIETDGWGLVLWAARMTLHFSCDLGWLDKQTWRGDTVYEGLLEVASDIAEHIQNDLPGPDASIWEVHWERRQVFGYTAACQIRGLYDFADIADKYGDQANSELYRGLADKMLAAMKTRMVYAPTQGLASHLGVAGSDVHVDGSTAESFSWDLIRPDDPIYAGSMNEYSKLLTGFGGYRRLEPQLSLTGQSGANEYDLSEWILLDLRIGDAWRAMGDAGKADALLNKITESAAVNDFLVPELFEPDVGSYAGVVPMVGYGAGAWIMSQMKKHGLGDPGIMAGFDHCGTVTPPDEQGGDMPVVELAEGEEVVQPVETADEPWTPTYDTSGGSDSTPYVPGGDDTTGSDDDGLFNDGPASFCAMGGFADPRSPSTTLFLLALSLALLAGAMLRRRQGRARILGRLRVALPFVLAAVLLAPSALRAETAAAAAIEDEVEEAWEVDVHGYARMPLRWNGSPKSPRRPYLVDDDYYDSGFQYLRVSEKEWGEIFLGVKKGRTRFVAGLFASQFSDWSERNLQAQWGIATASVEHSFELHKYFELDLRAGMFWERMGAIEPYDTYIFGRSHQAGGALGLRFERGDWRAGVRGGYGAHAAVVSDNTWFTPVAFMKVGGGWRFVDTNLFYVKSWTTGNEGFGKEILPGHLEIYGAEVDAKIPYVGPFKFLVAFYDASSVESMADALEVLHSSRGRDLMNNYLGKTEGGTGQMRAIAMDLNVQAESVLADVDLDPALRRWLNGLWLRMFGMTVSVVSEHDDPNPLEDRNGRSYLKWGIMPGYRLPAPVDVLWVALRYDRVIMDMDHDALSFRVITPMLGVTPVKGLDVFVSYSAYSYGDAIGLRPNTAPGQTEDTRPDDSAFKIQAQVTW